MQVQSNLNNTNFLSQDLVNTKSETGTKNTNFEIPKNLVEININKGAHSGFCKPICLPKCEVGTRPSPGDNTNPTKPSEEVDFKGLFNEMKNMLDGFLKDMKEMINQSLTDITNIVKEGLSSIFGGTPGTTKPPVQDTPVVPDKPVNTPNALPWNDKALEYLKPGSSGIVTEGELQEALVTFQVYQKSIPAQTMFRQEMEELKNSSSAVQSNIKSALSKVVEAGLISKEDANMIYSISHRAAQLDESVGAISNAKRDGALLSDAIKIGGDNLAKINSGEMEYVRRTID